VKNKLEFIKKIDKILTNVIQSGNDLLGLLNKTDDQELRARLSECIVVLSGEVNILNDYLMNKLKTYIGKIDDDDEFTRMMRNLEIEDGK
jgi:hypothetical protein